MMMKILQHQTHKTLGWVLSCHEEICGSICVPCIRPRRLAPTRKQQTHVSSVCYVAAQTSKTCTTLVLAATFPTSHATRAPVLQVLMGLCSIGKMKQCVEQRTLDGSSHDEKSQENHNGEMLHCADVDLWKRCCVLCKRCGCGGFRLQDVLKRSSPVNI